MRRLRFRPQATDQLLPSYLEPVVVTRPCRFAADLLTAGEVVARRVADRLAGGATASASTAAMVGSRDETLVGAA